MSPTQPPTESGEHEPNNLVIWTLNRISSWPAEELMAEFKKAGYNVKMGHRRFHGLPGLENKVADRLVEHGTLMCEESAYDEYFTPIPVKCIGDPASFAKHVLSHSEEDTFKSLIKTSLYADQYFRDETVPHFWKKYWGEHVDRPSGFPFTSVRMAAWPGDYRGYYEQIKDYGADSDAIRPLIPTETGHPFRRKPAADSDPNRPPIPTEFGHPLAA